MKKFILGQRSLRAVVIIPVLAAMVAGINPAQAENVKPTATFEEVPKQKATELADKASWMILLNFTNEDSLNAAKKICDEAIALDPECVDAYVQHGDANYFLGDYAAAEKDFDVAVQKRGSADDFQYRGECRYNLDNLEGALSDYKMAAQKGESNTESGANLAMGDANRLGIKLYNAEKYDLAVEAFTVSVNAAPNKNNIYNRGNAEYLSGNKESALQDWHTAGKMGNKDAKKSYKKFRKS